MKKIPAHAHFATRLLAFSTLIISLCAFASFTSAQESANHLVDILPTVSVTKADSTSLPEDTTHETIKMTPDKSEIIKLKDDAASIIVGNPLHINVIADTSKTLVIVPRSPGATHFTVLGKQGQIIMQRHVIVASPKEGYLRIRKTCREDSEGCQKTNVFYCPDMCHEIGLEQEESTDSSTTEAAQDITDGGASADSGDVPPEAD